MDQEKCKNCESPDSLSCWINGSRTQLCRLCISQILQSETPKSLVLINRSSTSDPSTLSSIQKSEQMRAYIQKRLERLQYLKSKHLLDLRLAGEELKRMIDKEIQKISQNFSEDCDKTQEELTILLKNFEISNKTSIKIINQNLVSPEPIEFEFNSEQILAGLASMVTYRIRDLEESQSKLVFFKNEQVHVFFPDENKLKIITKAKIRILKMSSICIVPNSWVFMAGGRSNTSTSNFCQKFRINRSRVFDLQPLNEARCAFAMVYVRGFVYVFGGKNNDSILSSCEKYNFKTLEWVNLPSMSEGKYETSAALAGNSIFICGLGSELIEKLDIYSETFESLLISKALDKSCRIFPFFDDKLILLSENELTISDTNGKIIASDQIDLKITGFSPSIDHGNWTYFEMNTEIWKLHKISNRIIKHHLL